ncbi:MAG: phosphate ABC transporter permease subunit PstC, partial [Planctomycetota bacterium]
MNDPSHGQEADVGARMATSQEAAESANFPEPIREVGNLSRSGRVWSEELIRVLLVCCVLVSVGTTVGIVVVLVAEAVPFFRSVAASDFFFGTKWNALIEPKSFGVLPLLCGSLLVVIGASLIALPIGLASSIYLSEYATHRTRSVLKPVLEILAGIPTIVYGYFALSFVTPVLRTFLPGVNTSNAASAAIVVGIMVLPMVVSLCDDAFRAVPDALRRGGFAVGATNFEVSTRIVLPAALSGVMASFVLALSRAIGETMAVTLAAGATPKLTLNPLESIQTMTAFIVQVSLGDTQHGTVEYHTIF